MKGKLQALTISKSSDISNLNSMNSKNSNRVTVDMQISKDPSSTNEHNVYIKSIVLIKYIYQ